VEKPSPLDRFGITINQFSIVNTEYDDQVLKQFVTKKEAYLAAESAKADVMKEQQETLKVIEKGKREVAEIEAEANKEKKKKIVEAEQKAEVAEIAKKEAVTVAMQAVEVAEQQALEQTKLAEIALTKKEIAETDAAAAIAKAEADQKRLEIAGGLSELAQAQIEADVKARIGVAEALSKIPAPGTVIMGGGSGGKGSDGINQTLIGMTLMKYLGLFNDGGLNRDMIQTPKTASIPILAAPADDSDMK
jgi:membrane protein involved in colicin uptake